MLESRQQVQFGYFLDFSRPSAINNLLKRSTKELTYLFTPEDTTYMSGDCQKQVPGLVPSTTRSIAKVLFWTGVSVATPLLLSLLAS